MRFDSRRRPSTTISVRMYWARTILAALVLAMGLAAVAAEPVSDDLLYDRVNRALITDRLLGTGQLEVVVKDGKVTVSGFVETEKLQKRVDKVVKKVKGVKTIDNRVKVKI